MNLEELYIKLNELGISKDRYYLHGKYGSSNDENKLAMIIKSLPSQGMSYEIYYKERGKKYNEGTFDNESEACNYFYEKMKESKRIEDLYIK